MAGHSDITDEIVRQFAAQFGNDDDVVVVMAPGRVNLLGDHTDYNDGFVLPMTLDRGVYVASRRRADQDVRIYSTRFGERLDFSLAAPPDAKPGHWSSYVVGIVVELKKLGLIDSGFDGVIHADLSAGAGLSSSAALEVAVALALQDLFGFELEATNMARLCQGVEHAYAGVQCGIMDQFASRLGRAGHALFLDCRSLDYRDIPLKLQDASIVIVNSNVRRRLTASPYNERRGECQQAVDYFRRIDPSIGSLRDVSAEFFSAHCNELSEHVRRRSSHVLTENERVLEASEQLAAGRLTEFGQLMNRSHESMRNDFEGSCPEIDYLVGVAQQSEGVSGARQTGGGFGGCTVNLVDNTALAAFQDRIVGSYRDRFGLTADIIVLTRNAEAGPVARGASTANRV